MWNGTFYLCFRQQNLRWFLGWFYYSFVRTGLNNFHSLKKNKSFDYVSLKPSHIYWNLDSCGLTVSSRVVNGETAARGQWPWQAQIRIHGLMMPHHCGGTLIHPQFVLTAAHCLVELPYAERYIISLGEYDLNW